MSHFIDRRQARRTRAPSTGSVSLKRYKSQLKRAVSDAVNRRSITDIDGGEKVGIPNPRISPSRRFHHRPDWRKDMIHPGNKEFEAGDRVLRPEEGSGGGRDKGGRERRQG
jgi:uncharacterized sporulation protein YeaH/YhbH (DUF444 family)